MAVHTDTKALLKYNPNRYPTIPGGEALYISGELASIKNAIAKLVDVVKMLEARMNTNGLT
jgi:hypothetical protein